MNTYRELLVWQKSMDLVTEIYRTSRDFPKEEIYGLMSQLRRAAVSVPSNVAEGFGRNNQKEFWRFLRISIASLLETQTQIEIAKNLDYLTESDFEKLFESSREIERMLASLIRKVQSNI